MKMSKKPTLKERYDKQVLRITREYSKLMEQPGTMVNASLGDIIGKTPSRITSKHVEALEKITPSKIRSYSSFYDIYTGEKLSYKDWRNMINNPSEKIENQEPQYIPTISIYEVLINHINDLPDVKQTFDYDGNVYTHPMDIEVKQDLIDIVNDKWAEDDENYAKYINDNMEDISDTFNSFQNERMYEDVYQGKVAKLYRDLQYGSMTPLQQFKSGMYAEGLNVYKGEDEE